MRYAYVKMTFHMMLVSFLALILIGCGESGTPGGASGPGVTASITLSAGTATLSADGLSSTPITAVLTDSVGASVYQQTSVVFSTNLGTFRNGAKEYRTTTADASGRVVVQLTAEEITGNAEVWVESNKVRQKVEVNFFDPHKVGAISLRTGSASIKADGISQVAITATVTDAQGNPEAGAEVKFNTTLGQFYEENPIDPSILNQNTTAVTDVDGEAVVMLVSGKTIGTATLLASVDGLNATSSVVFTADEPEAISLRAAPSTIRPNGTTNLFAKLKDINGNPVAGQTIVFSQTINASEGTLNSLSAPTNVNGEAQVTYTAGKDPGADIIQAALSNDLDMKATTTIVVDPDAIVIGGITVTAGAPSIVADGIGKVKIRATVTDVDGNPAVGKTVTFTRTAGTLSFTTVTTSDIGLAEVTLQASTIAGPATVRAECDGFIGDASVEFIPGPAHHLIMYALPNIVPPNGAFSTAVIIQDKYDNRIDDQRLMLQVRRAGYTEIVDSAELTPDQAEDGVFRFDWTAATAYGKGNLELTAKVNNGVSKTVTVVVDENAIIVGSISVISGAEAIEANGSDFTTIRATVLDSSDAPAEGITVAFKTTLGSVSALQKATDRNGIAEITLRSGTTWGTATVTADANGFKAQVDVLLTSGKAGGVSLTALPSTVLPGGQSSIIAEINNGKGAPVEDETLYFNLYDNKTNSVISDVKVISDVNGRATVTYTGGIIEGVDSIRVTAASDSRITATTRVTVKSISGTAGSMTLTSGAVSLPADGSSSTAITAVVLDAAGLPMPKGTEIKFETTLGTFANKTKQITISTADALGKAVVSLIAGSVPGQATIKATATASGLTQSITVSFTGGTVGNIKVFAEKNVLKANGLDQTIVTATVKTADNQAIEGAVVSFSTTGGTITTPFTTDKNGQAKATLTSGRYNGEAVITAKSTTGDIATTAVIFDGVTLTLSADPAVSFFEASNPNPSEIIAVLKDAEARPIEGENVKFELFSYDPEAVPPANPSPPIGSFKKIDFDTIIDVNGNAAVETDTYGNANINLLPSQSGRIYVRAEAPDSFGIEKYVTVMVTFNRYQLILTAAPTSIRVHETAEIIATLTENGVPKNNVTVFFSATLGTLIGGTTDITGVGVNQPGEAKTMLLAGNQSGKVTLNAKATIDGQELSAATEIRIIGGDASKIVLNANPGIISTDTGVSAINAIMYDINDQPAGNQKIYFRIADGPGGGEYLTESVKTTNEAGKTAIQLKAGSIPSNKIGDVVIEASNEPAFTGTMASATLTISGSVANISVSINLETVQTNDNQGHIEAGVSGIATDINGNPVADASLINFSVTSIAFDEDRDNDRTIDCWKFNGSPCDGTEMASDIGVTWFSDDINQDGTMYSLAGGTMATSEDKNQNGILDAGEDKNDNGVLDPPQGATIASPRQTANGIATTTIYYPMSYAENIKVRITAEAGGITNYYDSILLCTTTMVTQGTCGLGY